MEPTTLIILGLGVLILGWAIFWPKPRRETTPMSAPRPGDEFEEVGSLLRSAYDHARRQEAFGVNRRLESVKTYLASQAVGMAPPDEVPDPPAKASAKKAAPRKAPAKKATTSRAKPKPKP